MFDANINRNLHLHDFMSLHCSNVIVWSKDRTNTGECNRITVFFSHYSGCSRFGHHSGSPSRRSIVAQALHRMCFLTQPSAFSAFSVFFQRLGAVPRPGLEPGPRHRECRTRATRPSGNHVYKYITTSIRWEIPESARVWFESWLVSVLTRSTAAVGR